MEKKPSLPLVGALVERLRRRSDHEAVKAAMASKGDVTKMDGYANLSSCITQLSTIEAGSGSLGKPLRVARRAHAVLQQQRPAFARAFAPGGSEAVQLVYASAVAALWHTVSLLCADGVTFVKGATGNYSAVANRSGVDGMAGSIVVTRLEQFVDQAEKYGFDTVVTEAAPAIESEALREAVLHELVGTVIAGLGALTLLLYIARDLAEWFYALRGTFTRWLETQARFLEMNAAILGASKSAARSKQEEYASRLRALADRIRVDDADAARTAAKTIHGDDRSIDAELRRPSAEGAGVLL